MARAWISRAKIPCVKHSAVAIVIIFKPSEIRSILKAADYNIDKIRKAYELYSRQSNQVDNFVGWMISAIRNNYTMAGYAAKPIGEYVQGSFSHDDMESELLDNF